MKPALLGVIVGVVAWSVGCSRASNETVPTVDRMVNLPKNLTVSKPVSATQRFLQTNSPDVAFDTKTGTLCKTWNWAQVDNDTDSYTHRLSGTSTCDRLYQYDIEQEIRQQSEVWQHEKENGKAKP